MENNNENNKSLQEHRYLLNQLPSILRQEVLQATCKVMIDKFKFFQNKTGDFLWAFLPILKEMRVYSRDILYNQGDNPEEVFFITLGKVKLLYDFSEAED